MPTHLAWKKGEKSIWERQSGVASCNGNAKVTFISQNNNQTETETGVFRLEVLSCQFG